MKREKLIHYDQESKMHRLNFILYIDNGHEVRGGVTSLYFVM